MYVVEAVSFLRGGEEGGNGLDREVVGSSV